MNRRVRLAPVLAIMILAALAAAIGAAAASTVNARLYAKAGPVKMHADLSITAAQTGTSQSVKCTSSPGGHTLPPGSMAPSKFTCTGANGQKVTVPLASTTGTVAFHLAAKPTFALQSATIQIRHGGIVLATLSAPAAPAQATAPGRMSGSASIPGIRIAGLLNGRDTLYVRAGAHVYQGKISRVA
jgi:hypothetical protein